MSVGTDLTRLLDGLTRLSPQQRFLRAVPLPATAAFVGLVALAGGPFRPLFVLPAVLLAVGVTVLPDSALALWLLLDLAVLWSVAVEAGRDGPGPLVLLAAADLLLLHVAVTLAALGPPGTVLGRALLRRWALRTVLLLAAAVPVWLAARLVAGAGLPASAWSMAAGLVVLLAGVALLAVRLAPAGPADGGERRRRRDLAE